MKQGEIELIQRRITALQEDGFDLEAWKGATIVLLERIFGPGNQKAAQIEKIRYEQSSWALRDAKGSKKLIDSCKKQGEEILKVAIEELELVGLPADQSGAQQEVLTRVVTEALEQELKVAQFREVVAVLKSDRKQDDLRKAVLDKLREFGHETVPNILIHILMAKETRENL